MRLDSLPLPPDALRFVCESGCVDPSREGVLILRFLIFVTLVCIALLLLERTP